METEVATLAVGIEVTQGQGDCAEGQLVPGNFVFGEQRDFQCFDACREIQVEEASMIDCMHLTDVRHAD